MPFEKVGVNATIWDGEDVYHVLVVSENMMYTVFKKDYFLFNNPLWPISKSKFLRYLLICAFNFIAKNLDFE